MALPVPQDLSGWTKGLKVGPIAPISGVVYISRDTLGGRDPADYTFVITATANFSVEVEGPQPGVYAANPLHTTNNANADKLLVQRGRWNSLKITTAGNVYIIADGVAEAWRT